eukprot:tig00000093_g3672.t1
MSVPVAPVSMMPPVAIQQGQYYACVVPHNVVIPPSQYSTGLCDCHKDWTICFITCVCPDIQIGLNEEAFDGGSCCGTCCLHGTMDGLAWGSGTTVMGSMKRTKYRRAYNLEGSCGNNSIGDYCIYCWCPCCAICQDAREIKARGGMPRTVLMQAGMSPPPGCQMFPLVGHAPSLG